MKTRNKLIHELVKDTDKELSDEELMHQLLNENIAADVVKKREEKLSFGQKAADQVAKFVGTWAFIFLFLGFMIAWMIVNVVLASKAFDAYPFILLNLVLSCIAAVQAPLIMMSQNRQEEKDRRRSENDYKINLKNELVIADLHDKLDKVLENQKHLRDGLNEIRQRTEPGSTDKADTKSVCMKNQNLCE